MGSGSGVTVNEVSVLGPWRLSPLWRVLRVTVPRGVSGGRAVVASPVLSRVAGVQLVPPSRLYSKVVSGMPVNSSAGRVSSGCEEPSKPAGSCGAGASVQGVGVVAAEVRPLLVWVAVLVWVPGVRVVSVVG